MSDWITLTRRDNSSPITLRTSAITAFTAASDSGCTVYVAGMMDYASVGGVVRAESYVVVNETPDQVRSLLGIQK